MSGLLYDIQGYFDATYSGRYLAFILAELFRQEHQSFTRILNEAGIKYTHKPGDRAIANRWPFPIRGQQRFADIAVINTAGDPPVLVEIKDRDIKNESNAAQLNDYLQFIGQKKNQNCRFLFLSRTTPPEADYREQHQPSYVEPEIVTGAIPPRAYPILPFRPGCDTQAVTIPAENGEERSLNIVRC
jgi:hypothetical protein